MTLNLKGADEPINLERRTETGMRFVRWRHISLVFQGAMNSLDPVQRVEAQFAEAIRLHSPVGGLERGQRANRRAADDRRAAPRRSGAATPISSRAASASG